MLDRLIVRLPSSQADTVWRLSPRKLLLQALKKGRVISLDMIQHRFEDVTSFKVRFPYSQALDEAAENLGRYNLDLPAFAKRPTVLLAAKTYGSVFYDKLPPR